MNNNTHDNHTAQPSCYLIPHKHTRHKHIIYARRARPAAPAQQERKRNYNNALLQASELLWIMRSAEGAPIDI